LPSLSGTDVITTIAGDGTQGYVGDNGPAISARLNFPTGVAVDASGNVYIADYSNKRIRMVTKSTGFISTVAGDGTEGYKGDGGPAILAGIDYPIEVALDTSGNIYIVEAFNHRIRMVTSPVSSGIISTVAGDGTSGFSGDGGLATLAQLAKPNGVTVGVSGNIYIADTFNHCIRMVTYGTGIISTVAGIGTYGSPGNSGDGGKATLASLAYPYGVAIDASENIYIADTVNQRIRMVSYSTGFISTVADGTFQPIHIAADALGNIIFNDNNNHRILMVTKASSIITTVAGDGTSGFNGDGGLATSAKLKSPQGVALDSSGVIYISDAGNFRIRTVRPPPSPSPTAPPSPLPTAPPSPLPTTPPSPLPTAPPSPLPIASTGLPTSSCKTSLPISPPTRPSKRPVTAKPSNMPLKCKTKKPAGRQQRSL
jgi:trimeric autotransporter adhesin